MLLWIVIAIVVVWILAAILGVGSRAVFTRPRTVPDWQLEMTIRSSQKAMDASPIGSKAWQRHGAKFSAALDEQRRRAGLPPIGPFDRHDADD